MSHTETLEQAHFLLDHLVPAKLPAAIVALESLLDPVSRAIAHAPEDDEPETANERRAVAASRAEHRLNPQSANSHEE